MFYVIDIFGYIMLYNLFGYIMLFYFGVHYV